MTRPLRFMQINTFYPWYLVNFYTGRSQLQTAPFAAQIAALEEDGFSECHTFVHPMRELGFETMHVVANNPIAQKAWLRENGHDDTVQDAAAKALLLQVEAFQPDILYTNDPVTLHRGFLNLLKPRPAVIAGWRGFPTPAGGEFSAYDVILSSFDRIIDDVRAHGARRVERFYPGFAADHPVAFEPRQPNWDVVMSGSVTRLHRERLAITETLVQESLTPGSGFKLGLFMGDTAALSPAAQSLNQTALWGRDMLRLLRNARIVVNVNVDTSAADGQPPNMRLIEATGVGAFLLTSHHSELVKFFEPGTEIETFRNINELRAKLMYYLADDARRLEIAEAGRARSVRDHSLLARARDFADIMLRVREEKAAGQTGA